MYFSNYLVECFHRKSGSNSSQSFWVIPHDYPHLHHAFRSADVISVGLSNSSFWVDVMLCKYHFYLFHGLCMVPPQLLRVETLCLPIRKSLDILYTIRAQWVQWEDLWLLSHSWLGLGPCSTGWSQTRGGSQGLLLKGRSPSCSPSIVWSPEVALKAFCIMRREVGQ